MWGVGVERNTGIKEIWAVSQAERWGAAGQEAGGAEERGGWGAEKWVVCAKVRGVMKETKERQ